MPYRRFPAPRTRRGRRNLVIGGALLAGSAGFVNAVLLSFFQVPVSHMSGAVSHLGVATVTRPLSEVGGAFTIVAAFFLGCVLCGALVGRHAALPGRRYGVALIIQSAALAAAGGCLFARLAAGVPLAAFACGIQNAMSSSYYGLAIRTTHVTGTVTDLGVMVGHWIRHRRVSRWKARVLSALAIGFLVGGVVGAASIRWLDYRVLYLPALGTLAAGIAYYVRATRRRTRRLRHAARAAASEHEHADAGRPNDERGEAGEQAREARARLPLHRP